MDPSTRMLRNPTISEVLPSNFRIDAEVKAHFSSGQTDWSSPLKTISRPPTPNAPTPFAAKPLGLGDYVSMEFCEIFRCRTLQGKTSPGSPDWNQNFDR